MANVYVWSGATGTGTGADWANAYTTLEAAATAKAAGDIFFVAHDHAQTSAATVIFTFAGVSSNPNKIYCVNRAGTVPPVAADLRTTAQIITTSTSNISIVGTCDFYGLIFSAGDGASTGQILTSNGNNYTQKYTNCAFKTPNTSSGSGVWVPNFNNAQCILENCTFTFGANTLQGIYIYGRLTWRNTPNAIQGANIPDALIDINCILGRGFIEGVDFSAVPSGKSLFYNRAMGNVQIIVKDCKVASGVTLATGNTNSLVNTDYQFINVDSGDTNYRSERYNAYGTVTTEATIVHTGGANNGTNAIAYKMVTSSIARWEFPLECFPIVVWNESLSSSKRVDIEGIWGSGSLPNNDDIWIDVEYLGTNGFPLATKATSTKASGLATNSVLGPGTGTWGGSTTKFRMASAVFTPLEKGPFTIYVRAAKASSTFYIDPKPIVTDIP